MATGIMVGVLLGIASATAGPPGVVIDHSRNTLALVSSPDLTNWSVRSIVFYHPDVAEHGFRYVD